MYSRFYTRCFLIGTILVLGWVLLQFLDPFWAPLGWAAILAFLIHPLHKRLTQETAWQGGLFSRHPHGAHAVLHHRPASGLRGRVRAAGHAC